MPKNPMKPTRNNLKEEILQVINENFIEMILGDTQDIYSKTKKIENLRKHKNK
jgi:hypothetical protein